MDYTQPPAIVKQYKPGGLEVQLTLVEKRPSLSERRIEIRNLERRLENTLKFPCYTPASATKCYKFMVKGDGTLVAVFVFNIGVDKNTDVEESTQLDEIIHIKEIENASIISYKPAIPTKPDFWERYWKNPYNIENIQIDDGRQKEDSMRKVFEEYLKQHKPEFKKKPTQPRDYRPTIKA